MVQDGNAARFRHPENGGEAAHIKKATPPNRGRLFPNAQSLPKH